jgi:hypothetical protein
MGSIFLSFFNPDLLHCPSERLVQATDGPSLTVVLGIRRNEQVWMFEFLFRQNMKPIGLKDPTKQCSVMRQKMDLRTIIGRIQEQQAFPTCMKLAADPIPGQQLEFIAKKIGTTYTIRPAVFRVIQPDGLTLDVSEKYMKQLGLSDSATRHQNYGHQEVKVILRRKRLIGFVV